MRPSPTLPDYAAACASFSWRDARSRLPAMPGGGINIAHAALDRHLDTPTAEQTAIRFLPREGAAVDISYRELAERANRFANLLASLGLEPGDGVYCLAHRTPDLYAAALGTLKLGGVFTPLFSAFGPEPIRSRVEIGTPVVIVTTERLYRRKLAGWLHRMPSVKQVLLIGEVEEAPPGTLAVEPALAAQSPDYPTRPMEPEAPALLHFTSGTTGRPKGALHVHEAVVAHHITGHYALDLHPGDIYWCTADPGWVTGTSYGIIAPFTNGVTLVVDEEEFDAERWYRILEEQRVAVWYTAPTAIRMLMKVGPELARRYDLSSLRFLASVGEPLNPEAVHWGRATLGLPFHDNWWQTETGGIMIVPLPGATPLKPGSATLPFFGVQPALYDSEGNTLEGAVDGNLVITDSWPGQARSIWGDHERFIQTYFSTYQGVYFTGDGCRRDEDGYYWITGRVDDVINVSGHRMGTAEIESALVAHEAVAEAAVVGFPHDIKGQGIYIYVTLTGDVEPSDELRKELTQWVRKEIGPIASPDVIQWAPGLPKTRSGKIMRRILRKIAANECDGLGDTSTLADPSVVDDLIENRAVR